MTMLGYLIAALGAGFAFYIGRSQTRQTASHVVPEKVRHALDTLTEGLVILDEQEVILLANQSFAELVEIPANRLVGQRIGNLPWASGTAVKDSSPWARTLREGKPQTDDILLFEPSPEKQKYLMINATPIIELDRGVHGVLATFRDVTAIELRRSELEKSLVMMRTYRDQIGRQNRELQMLASHDPLTCCLNRRSFFQEFQPLLREASESGGDLTCLMIDNDYFKRINDQYGHSVGDEVLRLVAETLRGVVADQGLICRYGGEEFCVVLPDLDADRGAAMAETIRAEIESLRLKDQPELRLSVSIGVTDGCASANVDMDWINQADLALYAAKQQGRNRVLVFNPALATLESTPEAPRDPDEIAERDRMIPFEAVTALVSALAYRDRGTAEHSRRVADLCVQAATDLLDCRTTYILETAAMLHDIGKIGVPDSVLFKPSALSREEWKLIRQFDRVGAGIIAGTFNCDELNELIRYFHMPYGYRRAGEDQPVGPSMPLAARILAIADSYDSMRTDRSYRRGRSHEESIEELRRYAGVQFDPELVEHFALVTAAQPAQTRSETTPISKRTALQIGMQIERLARAIDAKDTEGLRSLAARLASMAREHGIEAIADAAEHLRSVAEDENTQWMRVLSDTQTLLGLCRATQNVFLASHDGGEQGSRREQLELTAG